MSRIEICVVEVVVSALALPAPRAADAFYVGSDSLFAIF
jgi:hypothetical protein